LRLAGGVVAAGLLAAGGLWSTERVEGQALQGGQGRIQSLTEPGDGLTIRQVSDRTGAAAFASTDGRGILLAGLAAGNAELRARAFVRLYGAAFGLADDSQVQLVRVNRDELGVEHVRFQQTHLGVPVVAGEFFVHLRGPRVVAANGKIVGDLPAGVTPTLTPAEAEAVARQLIEKTQVTAATTATYSAPRLEVLSRSVVEPTVVPSRLAWFVEATDTGLREFIWVDALTGSVLLHFSQLEEAKNRMIYDAGDTPTLPGMPIRSEGGPATGDADADAAYDYSGHTYDYFFTQHGRDSYNNAGATLHSTVHYCESPFCPGDPNGPNYPNAFWNGSQMVYGNGFSLADDVVAHELTHAVTQFSASLLYYMQSGALNESFSDIFGETVDLGNGAGTDTAGVRWQLGEDIPGFGPIRDMMTPTIFGDPGKISDAAQFRCDPYSDNGGVHTNSGVPNHAYALMVDGGSYNGRTISAIGSVKAGKIEYRALTVYLTSGSGFLDDYTALIQSCMDLIGTSGITAGDCTQVKSAVEAVEMNRKWPCTGAVAPPPLCPTGAAPASTVFLDTFETGITNWTTTSSSTTQWVWLQGWAKGGTKSLYGDDPGIVSDHRAAQTAGVVIPANGRLYFDHGFGFEFFEFEPGMFDYYDGGVLEYSTDGVNWLDAGGLIDAGQAYGGNLFVGFGNPLAGRQAFVRASFGYTGTRLNLASLAGQNVRFRFRVGSDSGIGDWGWTVDNVRIYTCGGSQTDEFVQNGNFADGGSPPGTPPANWLTFDTPPGSMEWNVSGGVFRYRRNAGSTQGVVFQQTGITAAAGSPLAASFAIGNSMTQRRRMSILIHDADFTDLFVCTFWLEPDGLLRTYQMKTHTTKAWTNATISFYAAGIVPPDGIGYYLLDDVSLRYMPGTQSDIRTDCVDPTAPGAGGVTSGNLVTNGGFDGGVITPWGTFGNIQFQLAAGVFEFFKLAGSPAGVVLQGTGQAMTNDQRMTASFQLGNSSGLRQRVTILLHDGDFLDLTACTFWIPPGLPLSNFAIRSYATKAWTNATVSVYPATVGTSPSHEWLRLDNVSLMRTTTAILGTECFEPGVSPTFLPGANGVDAEGAR
jgi:Zn-dependent metalloprotease